MFCVIEIGFPVLCQVIYYFFTSFEGWVEQNLGKAAEKFISCLKNLFYATNDVDNLLIVVGCQMTRGGINI